MPENPSPIALAERRAWIYCSADGLPSILIGLGCLTLAFVLCADHSRLPRVLDVVLVVSALTLYSFIMLRNRQILEWLKARLTYPRTGYVAPPYSAGFDRFTFQSVALDLSQTAPAVPSELQTLRQSRGRWTLLLLLTNILVTIAALVVSSPWICILFGFTTAGALWWGTRFDKSLSWIVIVGFVLLGFYMAIFSVPPPERLRVMVAGWGSLFVLGGTVTFLRFLCAHPAAHEERPN